MSLSGQTFALSLFAYDLQHFAVLAAFMVVEAAVRQRAGAPDNMDLAKVIKRAAVAGVLTPEMRQMADDFRTLRNSAAHPDQPFLVGAGGTAGLLTHAHDFVGRLYPDA